MQLAQAEGGRLRKDEGADLIRAQSRITSAIAVPTGGKASSSTARSSSFRLYSTTGAHVPNVQSRMGAWALAALPMSRALLHKSAGGRSSHSPEEIVPRPL
jgi:hypothetical protein